MKAKKTYRIFDRQEKIFVPKVTFKNATDANKYCTTLQALIVQPVKRRQSSDRRFTYTALTLEQRVCNELYAELTYRYR